VNNSYKINGARQGGNLFLLNGAPISSDDGSWRIAPNGEAVQEFKVMTNTYDAAYGEFREGAVNTTKSGSNRFSGTVYECYRTRILDANSFQSTFTPRHWKIPRTYQYTFGFQHELPYAIVAEISFAGNRQIYGGVSFDMNWPAGQAGLDLQSRVSEQFPGDLHEVILYPPGDSYNFSSSRNRFVWTRLTGISVPFLSSMRSWKLDLNQGITSRIRLMLIR